jgi:methanogenic corrinoid protein MtbC1
LKDIAKIGLVARAQWAEEIGADGWGEEVGDAVQKAKELVGA